MAHLLKQDVLIKRDEKGDALPVEWVLEDGRTVLLTPLTLGEIAALENPRNSSGEQKLGLTKEIIVRHMKDPAFTREELENIQPLVFSQLLEALKEASGQAKKPKEKESTTS